MKDKWKGILYIFLPIVLGGIVGVITSGSFSSYANLERLPLSPPGWLFPVVWSILYLLMGISYYLYKKEYEVNGLVDRVYYAQLFVNLVWPIIFFVWELRLAAVIWIILLFGLVGYMIYLFWNRKKVSAYLNIPYIIWVLFATYLTIGVYVLN